MTPVILTPQMLLHLTGISSMLIDFRFTTSAVFKISQTLHLKQICSLSSLFPSPEKSSDGLHQKNQLASLHHAFSAGTNAICAIHIIRRHYHETTLSKNWPLFCNLKCTPFLVSYISDKKRCEMPFLSP